MSSKGSVVAEFQLMFGSKVSSDEAFADLKNQISDGNLGNLQVDPESLEQIFPATQGIFLFSCHPLYQSQATNPECQRYLLNFI